MGFSGGGGVSRPGDASAVLNASEGSFGELRVAEQTPVLQLTPNYNVQEGTDNIATGGGTVSFSGSLYSCDTGTTAGAAAGIRGIRRAVLKAGQGFTMMVSAAFPDAPVVNALVAAGGFNGQDSLAFGWAGSGQFGVIHRYGGELEVRALQVTAAASGAETVTVELDGVSYPVPVTSGTKLDNAREIAAGLRASAAADSWVIEACGDTVLVRSFLIVAPRNGAYSASSTGTLTASWSQVTAGVVPTVDVVAQADWNRKPEGPFDGFDITKLNNYVISCTHLGAGPIEFAVIDPATSRPEVVHYLEWKNKDAAIMTQSILSVGYFCQSLGSTTQQRVRGAGVSASIQGIDAPLALGRSRPDTVTMAAGVYRAGVIIRCREIFGGRANLSTVELLKAATASEAPQAATMRVLKNPTDGSGNPISDVVNFTEIEPGSIVEVGDVTTAPVVINPASGREIGADGVAKENNKTVTLLDVRETLDAGDVLVVAVAISSGSSSPFISSVSWRELI